MIGYFARILLCILPETFKTNVVNDLQLEECSQDLALITDYPERSLVKSFIYFACC